MNSICNVEFSEYAGQYTSDWAGAISGCNCFECRGKRERPLTGREYIETQEERDIARLVMNWKL